MTTVLLVLVVVALLCACLSFVPRWPLATLQGSVILLAVVLLLMLVGNGCASTERNGTELRFVLRDDPHRPAPACKYVLTIDGELLHEGSVDSCPRSPACEEP